MGHDDAEPVEQCVVAAASDIAFAGATDADRAAIETFGEALAGTDKPFVIASGILGVLGLPPGVVWPAVHRDDAARLFRLALESAPPGSALHAVGDEGVPIREVAEVLASHLNLPALSVTPEQIEDYVGFLGGFWGFDGPASAQITRDLLGWRPTRPGLIADLEEGHYFT
ncbi:hypothetical protein [Frankia sp. QA3]|uniref:hypothetical protein n=1 Tax=Frankia sp. QA3 TaxID=710111 RepID=UPI0002DBE566|nr:hypothetical protein [Frankia sp. QA3]